MKTDLERLNESIDSKKKYPMQPEFCCAVTGTNGKSSSCYFLERIWSNCGMKSANLGTNGLFINGRNFPEVDGLAIPNLTTPCPLDLHRILNHLESVGVTNFVFEASSHAIDQKRLHSVHLQAAAITNVSSDHLDYHKTNEKYLETKLKLFSEILPENNPCVVYKEDEYLAFRVRQNNKNIITCGIDSVEDVCAYNINLSLQRIFFDLKIINSTFRSVSSGIFGKMHLKNLLVAISLAKISGIPDDLIVNAIEGLKNLEGRSEYVGSLNGCSIYVDYAHTADGLRNLLKEFREVCDGRLLLVFGCGGDRDRWKRAEMGECASEMADIVIVTDDNPRSEDPWQIRREILARCSKGLEIPDRGEAISHSMSLAKSGDVLLVCGKGHEKVQIYGDKIVNFNDKDVISRLIKKHTDQ